MQFIDNLLLLPLTLFDDGGAAPTAAAPAADQGGESAKAGSQQAPGSGRRGKSGGEPKVVYGRQPEGDGGEGSDAGSQQQEKTQETPAPAKTPEERKAEFEKLISGEYQDEFTARTQEVIDRRFRETRERAETVQPLLDLLGQKYGVDASDAKALQKAVEADDSYWEQAAESHGMNTEQYRQYAKMQSENAALKRAQVQSQAQQKAAADMQRWNQEAETVRQTYPELNLREEVRNPAFIKMLTSGVGVKAAYEALHMDTIQAAIARKAAEAGKSQVTESIRAKGARPAENGVSSQVSTIYKTDVSKLTRADRAEIAKRVMRGEDIKF